MNKRRNSINIIWHRNDAYACRWSLFVRLFFVLSIVILITAYAGQFSYANDKESVDLYLDINFDSNLIMNKYDVSFELDGEHLDTIEHGLYYTKLCQVEPGKHVLRVYKNDDPDVVGEETIKVKEDTTFQSQLKTKRKEIEFEDATTFKGTAGHSIEMPDCVGLHIVDALAVLEEKGFVKYSYKSDTEEKVKEKSWDVDIQNVKAGEIIDKNDEIILTCVPAEEYVEKTFTGMAYSDAIEKAKAIGYKKIQKIDTRQKTDEPKALRDADISDEAKKYWTVYSAEDRYTEDATLVLNFVYNVQMPNLSKVGLEKADSQLKAIQQGHFTYDFVGYKTGDSIIPDNFKKYFIIEQSEEPGTIITYNSEITFRCKKTKAAKEAEKKAQLAAAAAAKKEADKKAKETMVWISKTGKCYHSKSTCSNMRNPWQVPLSEAKRDRKACTKCY